MKISKLFILIKKLNIYFKELNIKLSEEIESKFI